MSPFAQDSAARRRTSSPPTKRGTEPARFVQAFMFRTDAREPIYHAAVAGMSIVTAAAAAYLPARPASHADPIVVLKAQ